MSDPRLGNDWARGASGGSAPEDNQNGMKHGLHSDPVNLFDWLWENEEHGANWIIEKMIMWQERASFKIFQNGTVDMSNKDGFQDNLTAVGDDLLSVTVRDYARKKAEKEQLVQGLTKVQHIYNGEEWVEQEEANPINLELDRMDRSTLSMKKALGLLDTPEEQQADSSDKFAEAMKELAEKQDG